MLCVSLKFPAQGVRHISRYVTLQTALSRRTRAFINERRQMSESEEKEMIVNPFRTSGLSFQQENERFIPLVLWHILFGETRLRFTWSCSSSSARLIKWHQKTRQFVRRSKTPEDWRPGNEERFYAFLSDLDRDSLVLRWERVFKLQ